MTDPNLGNWMIHRWCLKKKTLSEERECVENFVAGDELFVKLMEMSCLYQKMNPVSVWAE